MLEGEIPKEKRYLLKYFRSDLQDAFLRYYLLFGSYEFFAEHTGMACAARGLKYLEKKIILLEEEHAKAKADLNFEELTRIETGKFPLKNRHRC